MPATVRREWTLLNAAIKIAIDEWRWMDENPMKTVKRPEKGAPRTRLPTDAEIKLIQEGLGYSANDPPFCLAQFTAEAMMFVLQTAMRDAEVCTLTWDNVDFEKLTAFLPKTKNGEARYTPLSKEAIRILRKMETIKRGDTVFQINTSQRHYQFKTACDTAKIEDLHFHDFRAHALSRMAQIVPILTLAKISGHKDINMLMIYYRDTPTEIAAMLG